MGRLVLLSLLALSGCYAVTAREAYGPVAGHGSASFDDAVTLDLGGIRYHGTLNRMLGSLVTWRSAFGRSGDFHPGESAAADAVTLLGNGTATLTGPEGGLLRCVVAFDRYGLSGHGQCLDASGRLYLIRIN